MMALGCSVSPRPTGSSKPLASLDVGCDLPTLEITGREGGRACSSDTSPLYVGSFTTCINEANGALHQEAREEALAREGFHLIQREFIDAEAGRALDEDAKARLVPDATVLATDGEGTIRKVVGQRNEHRYEYGICGCGGLPPGTPDDMPLAVDRWSPYTVLLEPDERLGPDLTYEYEGITIAQQPTGTDCDNRPPMP